jgi:hypothetical protein
MNRLIEHLVDICICLKITNSVYYDVHITPATCYINGRQTYTQDKLITLIVYRL